MNNEEINEIIKAMAYGFSDEEVAEEYKSRAFYVSEREANVLQRTMDKLKPVLDKVLK